MSSLPRHVSSFVDRHGRIRYRFRRGNESHYINAAPDTGEFRERYQACVEGRVKRRRHALLELPVKHFLLSDLAARSIEQGREYVYFVEQERGPIKIGRSSRLYDRFRKLQTGSPVSLTLLALFQGGAALERELHQRFADYHIVGEWFKRDDALLAFAKKHDFG